MASWLVAAGLVAGLFGQTENNTGSLPGDEAICRAIVDLGDDRFSVRERASRFLWSQGEAAEPALKQALHSDDAEVAYRARRILNDFRYGIFPGLPEQTLATIRLFRSGDRGQRVQALEQLAQQQQAATLRRLFKLEPVADVRRQLLDKLVQLLPSEVKAGQMDRLTLVLDLIADEPERGVRSQSLARLLSQPQAVNLLAGSNRLEAVFKLAEGDLDAEARKQILQRLLQSPAALESMLADGGIDRLLALAAMESDPPARGQLLAAVITSAAVEKYVGEEKIASLAIDLARRQEDPAARGNYLNTVLWSPFGHKMLQDGKTRAAFWALVKERWQEKVESVPDWRVEVTLSLLSKAGADELLPQAEDSQWLLRFAGESLAGGEQTRLLERLASDYYVTRALIRHAQLESLLTLIRDLPADRRGPLLSRLVASAEVSQALASADRIEVLVSLAEQESDAEARGAYLAALFRNRHAMTELVDRGFYDALWEMVSAEQDAVRRAGLRGAFFATNAVLNTCGGSSTPIGRSPCWSPRGTRMRWLRCHETEIQSGRQSAGASSTATPR